MKGRLLWAPPGHVGHRWKACLVKAAGTRPWTSVESQTELAAHWEREREITDHHLYCLLKVSKMNKWQAHWENNQWLQLDGAAVFGAGIYDQKYMTQSRNLFSIFVTLKVKIHNFNSCFTLELRRKDRFTTVTWAEPANLQMSLED